MDLISEIILVFFFSFKKSLRKFCEVMMMTTSQWKQDIGTAGTMGWNLNKDGAQK